MNITPLGRRHAEIEAAVPLCLPSRHGQDADSQENEPPPDAARKGKYADMHRCFTMTVAGCRACGQFPALCGIRHNHTCPQPAECCGRGASCERRAGPQASRRGIKSNCPEVLTSYALGSRLSPDLRRTDLLSKGCCEPVLSEAFSFRQVLKRGLGAKTPKTAFGR